MMAAAPEASSKRQRILIVEDEPFIRLALEAMLPDLGYEVAGSASVVSNALDLIESEQIDCAILDVNLGLQRIDPVADLLAARGCPFVFTTGHGVSGLPSRHAGRPPASGAPGRQCVRHKAPKTGNVARRGLSCCGAVFTSICPFGSARLPKRPAGARSLSQCLDRDIVKDQTNV